MATENGKSELRNMLDNVDKQIDDEHQLKGFNAVAAALNQNNPPEQRRPVIRPQMLNPRATKSISQLLLESAARETETSTENQKLLYSCYGELLALSARYMAASGGMAPDRRAAATRAMLHLAEILTAKDFSMRHCIDLAKATGDYAQMATEGYSAPLADTLAGQMPRPQERLIAREDNSEALDEKASGG